jgi:hypothetical protein
MRYRSAWAAVAWLACAFSGCVIPAQGGSPETGYVIEGFVGRGSAMPAANVAVSLVDETTGQTVGTAQTNFFGKYRFSALSEGKYIIRAEQVEHRVVVAGQGVRLDLDLNAPGGVMDYGRAATPAGADAPKAPAGARAPKASTGAPKVSGIRSGRNNAELARQIAGVWWGYSGSTERKIGLCPGGTYREYTESSYSGRSHDSLGNQAMAWGAASQGAKSGSWVIQGDTESGTIQVTYSGGGTAALHYRQVGEPGCLDISGSRLCRTSATCDRE